MLIFHFHSFFFCQFTIGRAVRPKRNVHECRTEPTQGLKGLVLKVDLNIKDTNQDENMTVYFEKVFCFRVFYHHLHINLQADCQSTCINFINMIMQFLSIRALQLS